MKTAFHAAFFLLVASYGCNQKDTRERADLILMNGKIWTAEGDSTFSEAVAIHGDTISFVGKSEEIMLLAGEKTKVIDLKGRLAGPGFNDAHIHFLSGSLGLSQVELNGSGSVSEMLMRIKDYADKNPGAAWITGRGWQYTKFVGGLPTRQMLDSLISDRPVFIRAYDGHSAWANSKALSLAGIIGNTKFKGYGEIVKDKNGMPTGALIEGAQSLIGDLVPDPSRAEKLNALRNGMKLAASLGITSIQNASGSIAELSLYEELKKNNELTLRVRTAFSITSSISEAQIDSLEKAKNRIGTGPTLRAGAVKFMLDGVIESHTAAMLQPYNDENKNDRNKSGSLGWPVERYRDLVARFDKMRFQIYTHAIGDKAVREALDAYELAKKMNQGNPHHRIEHIETISPIDLPRFAALGVLPSMEPIHADPGTMTVWISAIGNERLPQSFAWSSMLKNNASLVFSSDWPACISLDPIRGIHVAINRRTPGGYPEGGWIPEQKISVAQALKAYTRMGAYSSSEDQIKGKIAPGYLADLIVFSDNLFEIDPMKIHEVQVQMTIFNGKIVYIKELQ